MRRERKGGRPAGDELFGVCEGFKRCAVNVLCQTDHSNQICHTSCERLCSVTAVTFLSHLLADAVQSEQMENVEPMALYGLYK